MRLFAVSLFASTLDLTGCAVIFDGTSQSITVNTNPPRSAL